MIELHGWITVRDTYEAIFEEGDKMDLVISKLKDEIGKLRWFQPQIKAQNGEVYIEFTLFANRKESTYHEIIEFYKKVGDVAKGSYGLIYFYDDEDRDGQENEFQVYALRRGKIESFKDPFLSPIIPVIEDEDF